MSTCLDNCRIHCLVVLPGVDSTKLESEDATGLP